MARLLRENNGNANRLIRHSVFGCERGGRHVFHVCSVWFKLTAKKEGARKKITI